MKSSELAKRKEYSKFLTNFKVQHCSKQVLLKNLDILFRQFKQFEYSEYSYSVYLETREFVQSIDIKQLMPELAETWFYPIIMGVRK